MDSLPPGITLDRAKEMFESKATEFVREPGPALRKIREQAPVYYSEQLEGWVVSRRSDIADVMRNVAVYSNKDAMISHVQLSPAAAEILGDSAGLPNFLGNVDGEHHRRLRGPITRAFTPRRMEALTPFIRQTAARLADSFAETLGEGPAEFRSGYALPLPAPVTARLLGLPDSDADFALACVADWFRLYRFDLPEDEQVRCAWQLRKFYEYVAELIDKFRARPVDNLICELVRDIDSGAIELSEQELIDLVANLFVGGLHTTANAMTAVLYRVLNTEGAWARLQADPASAAQVSEEGFRLEGIAFAAIRNAVSDTVLQGQEIRAGEQVYLLSRSADLDPEFFPDPDSFCPQRENAKRHLNYGIGPHICIGAPLARLEMAIGLEELAKRLPEIRQAKNVPAPSFLPAPTQRQLDGLYVELHPQHTAAM
jgi:cytochrome P450